MLASRLLAAIERARYDVLPVGEQAQREGQAAAVAADRSEVLIDDLGYPDGGLPNKWPDDQEPPIS